MKKNSLPFVQMICSLELIKNLPLKDRIPLFNYASEQRNITKVIIRFNPRNSVYIVSKINKEC